MKKILILFLFVLSCSKDSESQTSETLSNIEDDPVAETLDYNNDPIYSKVKPILLSSYWDAFVLSAALYDVDLSYLEDVKFVPQDLGGSTAGIANGSCLDNVLILVDETIFRNLSTGEQLFLMYHELGHDVFNASHDGGGLMAPNVRSLDYDLFQTEVKDFFTGADFIQWTDEECEYIRELVKDGN
tara:strand:- start:11986 stop:12543 length:558 start_codon:yes stop_codon:yes gene_type:complete